MWNYNLWLQTMAFLIHCYNERFDGHIYNFLLKASVQTLGKICVYMLSFKTFSVLLMSEATCRANFRSGVLAKCHTTFKLIIITCKVLQCMCYWNQKKVWSLCNDHSSRGVGRLWGDKALEGQAICEQWLAPQMLCLLRAFRCPCTQDFKSL